MSDKKFNREYKDYQPSVSNTEGPPTNRICKPVQCNNKNKNTPSQ